MDEICGGAEGAATVSSAVVGTPDDLVAAIRHMYDVSGGFGLVLGFVHDWANREDTRRSWELFARYVIPEVNGLLRPQRESQRYVIENRAIFDRATQAVLAKINENERAAEALQVTLAQRAGASR